MKHKNLYDEKEGTEGNELKAAKEKTPEKSDVGTVESKNGENLTQQREVYHVIFTIKPISDDFFQSEGFEKICEAFKRIYSLFMKCKESGE